MLTDHDPDRNVGDLTEAEIYAAIRYLEPHPRSAKERHSRSADEQNEDSGVLICVGFMILLFGCLGFMLLYWR
jgi:hypothetical protein